VDGFFGPVEDESEDEDEAGSEAGGNSGSEFEHHSDRSDHSDEVVDDADEADEQDNSLNFIDEYAQVWNTEKHWHHPCGYCKKVHDPAAGKVTFWIPDKDWAPPESFVLKLDESLTPEEIHRARRDAWKKAGGKIPLEKCEPFHPYEGMEGMKWEDTFVDRITRRRRRLRGGGV